MKTVDYNTYIRLMKHIIKAIKPPGYMIKEHNYDTVHWYNWVSLITGHGDQQR